MIYKSFLTIVPVLLVIVVSICQELLLSSFHNKLLRAMLYAATGIAGGYVIYIFIGFIIKKSNILKITLGSIKSLLWGIFIGLIASITSGLLYYFTSSTYVSETELSILSLIFNENTGVRFISNLSPAIVEELGFRGGLVHILNAQFGELAGLLGGSIPFGVLHIIGRIFGQPVGISHIIGVTFAGLLLSLLYLRYGLLSAIGCHWIWNSLVRFWVSILDLPKKGGIQVFEGSWTTSVVLAALCIMIYFIKNKKESKIVKYSKKVKINPSPMD